MLCMFQMDTVFEFQSFDSAVAFQSRSVCFRSVFAYENCQCTYCQ